MASKCLPLEARHDFLGNFAPLAPWEGGAGSCVVHIVLKIDFPPVKVIYILLPLLDALVKRENGSFKDTCIHHYYLHPNMRTQLCSNKGNVNQMDIVP